MKFSRLAGYGCRFGVIELSFVRVDGDAEAVKVRMTGDFGFGGNSRTFTPPSSPNDQFERASRVVTPAAFAIRPEKSEFRCQSLPIDFGAH
jgi:hypothetical protein